MATVQASLYPKVVHLQADRPKGERLKIAMCLALKYLQNVPESERRDYVVQLNNSNITYYDAVEAVECIADSI
jgi:hypothetical protein